MSRPTLLHPHPSTSQQAESSACADALAGGCELALGCDMLVASHRARFGVPEVTRSLVPTGGGVVLLPRVLPYASSWPIAGGPRRRIHRLV